MNHSAPHSLCGCGTRSALDGLLPVHPLVLDDVPAALRASTWILKSPRRRCPPAANPRSRTGGWSGREGPTPSGGLPLPSQPPRIQLPSHSRHASRRLVSMGISPDAYGVRWRTSPGKPKSGEPIDDQPHLWHPRALRPRPLTTAMKDRQGEIHEVPESPMARVRPEAGSLTVPAPDKICPNHNRNHNHNHNITTSTSACIS